MSFARSPIRVLSLVTALAVAAGAASGCSDVCEGVFGPNFQCGGRAFLTRGAACWTNAPGSDSLYAVDLHSIVWRGGLPCPAGTFCHPTTGCTELLATGANCEGMSPEVLWGACASPADACYPADPVDGGRNGGPRVCRPLPSAEGAFCDASVKPDCDAEPEPWVAGRLRGPEHAWLPLSAVDNPRWSGEGFLSTHLGVYGFSEWQYPILRLHDRVCLDQRCVRAPGPGEPCAVLGPSATFPAPGHLAHICAQPAAFTVTPDDVGLGLGATRDFSQAVLCVGGRCTPRSELSPGSCLTLDGASPPNDPTLCSDVASECPAGFGATCLTPCRADGTCGQCNVCEHPDGTRTAVPDESACAPQHGPWELASPRLVTAVSAPPVCGDILRTRFIPSEPVTGELWLEISANGAFSAPGAALDVFVDGARLDRWSPGQDCAPAGRFEPPAATALRLDPEVAADGVVEVELRGTPALCATCLDPAGCRDSPDCPGNDAVLTLSHRVRIYRGPTRDDAVCQPR